MLQGLFYISLFFITILGILILRPTPIEPLIQTPTPTQLETRNQVTRGMAQFLEKNPEILSHSPHVKPIQKPTQKPIEETATHHAEAIHRLPAKPIEFQFKGTALHFQNQDDLNLWLFEAASQDAEGFLKNLDPALDPELKLDLLKKTGDLEIAPAAKELTKEMLLSEAQSLLKVGDGGHEQLAEKYLNYYLEKETNAQLAKKRVDEILRPSSTPHP
jgi:hypothetical protein